MCNELTQFVILSKLMVVALGDCYEVGAVGR